MTLPAGTGDKEILRLILDIDSRQANESLEEATKSAQELAQVIRNTARKTGASYDMVAQKIREVIALENQRRAAASTQHYDVAPLRVTSQQVSEGHRQANKERRIAIGLQKIMARQEREAAAEVRNYAASVKQLQLALERASVAFGNLSPKQLTAVRTQLSQIGQLNFSRVETSSQNVAQLMGNIRTISQQTGRSFNEIGRYIQQNFQNVPKWAVNDAVNNLNNQVKKTTTSAKGLNNILRLIRGTLVAIGVFRVFAFFEESLRKASEAAEQFETSMYRIANVERILSQQGIETSVAGLRDVIEDVKKSMPIFSRVDIMQQVSLIGIMTKEFGLTEEKIGQVAKAIGVLNVRSGETEDLLTTTNKVLTALVAPSGRGLASLGLDFGQANLEAMAFKNGVLEAGEAFSDLSKHDKDMLKIAVLLESTGEELTTIRDFLETNTGALAEQNAEWEDTLVLLGQATQGVKASLAPVFIEILKGAQDAIQGFKVMAIIWQALKREFYAFAAALAAFFRNPREFVRNFDAIKEGFANIFVESLEEGFNRMFSGVIPADAPQWFENLFGQFATGMDEPTAAVERFGATLQSLADIEGFDDLIEDIIKLEEKLEEAREEFERDWAGADISIDVALNLDTSSAEFDQLGRDVQDYVIKIQRLVQDYALRRAKVIQDANNAIADANAKYRNNQITAEARFQEQMRQLREGFFFNLEDALRERDARQVLRLQKQFAMDKKALEEEHRLRQEEMARQHKLDLARIEREREERLAALAQEEQLRLERERQDFELRQQRAEEDKQRELEKIQEQVDEKLRAFAEAIGEEYDLNEDAVQRLYDLLKEYYGADGAFADLFNSSAQTAVHAAQTILDSINAIIAGAQSLGPAIEGFASILRAYDPYYQGGSNDLGGQAEGGTYLATRPTTATFGEAGPEIAQFIPLRGNMAKSALGISQGKGGMGGDIRLLVELSPDLETRIIDKSLDNMAAIIRTVDGEK